MFQQLASAGIVFCGYLLWFCFFLAKLFVLIYFGIHGINFGIHKQHLPLWDQALFYNGSRSQRWGINTRSFKFYVLENDKSLSIIYWMPSWSMQCITRPLGKPDFKGYLYTRSVKTKHKERIMFYLPWIKLLKWFSVSINSKLTHKLHTKVKLKFYQLQYYPWYGSTIFYKKPLVGGGSKLMLCCKGIFVWSP